MSLLLSFFFGFSVGWLFHTVLVFHKVKQKKRRMHQMMGSQELPVVMDFHLTQFGYYRVGLNNMAGRHLEYESRVQLVETLKLILEHQTFEMKAAKARKFTLLKFPGVK